MSTLLHTGVVANTPAAIGDKIKVSVPDLTETTRFTYGPLDFNPVPAADGTPRLPQAGDRAIVAVDEETAAQFVIFWYRDGE